MTNECKFKVGDKVKRKDGDFFSNEEKVVTVSHILLAHNLVGGFVVVFAETGTNMHEDALELVETSFTKADLKDGMVVTYRDGEERVVFAGNLFKKDFDFLRVASPLKWYSEELATDSFRSLDIMKVTYMDEVLWEREEETAEQKRIKELEEGIAKMQEELNKLL